MTENTQPMPEFELTDADRRKIQEIAEKIDLTDSALCLSYGTVGQKKLADVSDKLLKMTRSDDSAAVSERMSDLMKELREVSSVQLRGGFFGWLFRRRDRKNLRKRYESAAKSTDAIAVELENYRNRLLRDFVMLDKLYDSVLEQYRNLTVLAEAGQRKLDEDISAEKELRERFEKHLCDMKLSRMVCMQTLTQIRVLQGCNTALSEKIQSLLTNTMALWKNQMSFALGMENVQSVNNEMLGMLKGILREQEEHDRTQTELKNTMKEFNNEE